MAPQERQTLVAGMSPDQQQQLQSNVVSSINKGWIDPALLTQPAAGTTPPMPATAAVAPAAAVTAPPAALPLTVRGNGQPAVIGGY